MGFFGALGKILAGKPVYGPEDGSTPPVGAQPQPGVAAGPQSAQRIIPVVRVARVESPISGSRMEVNLEIRNESPVTVWIHRVHLLGAVRELNDDLQPGQSHEFQIYAGPVPRNDALRQAEVEYRTEAGSYFSARHDVLYRQQPDGWHVYQLRLMMPIKELR
jgi:hypothetical protein